MEGHDVKDKHVILFDISNTVYLVGFLGSLNWFFQTAYWNSVVG